MLKKSILMISNSLLKRNADKFIFGWFALVMILQTLNIIAGDSMPNIKIISNYLFVLTVLLGIVCSAATLAMQPLKHCFAFDKDGVVRIFDSWQYIWKKDFDAMKPNLASYEERRVTLSFKCTDEQDNVSIISILISFGGTPEEMLEVIRRFGNNGIIDEMKRRLEAGGVCNIDATNNLSIVQGILGESVHVLQIIKEQSLYCTIDNIYLEE